MADRFGELYMDQGDIGYAGAKIAVKRCVVLSEKANCFYEFLAHILQTVSVFSILYFSVFFIFLQVHEFTNLKVYPSFEKPITCILYNFFIRYYDCLWLSSFVATMEKKPTLLRH